MNAQSTKGVLQMVGTFLNISIYMYSNDKVEVSIYQLFVFSCYHILHLLDVLHGYLVAWIWHTGMTVFLLVEKGEFSFLVGNEEHLIIHNYIGRRNAVNQ